MVLATDRPPARLSPAAERLGCDACAAFETQRHCRPASSCWLPADRLRPPIPTPLAEWNAGGNQSSTSKGANVRFENLDPIMCSLR